MEKKIDDSMEAGVIRGLFRDPSIQIVPTLVRKERKCYLHWAIWIPRVLHTRQYHSTIYSYAHLPETPSNLEAARVGRGLRYFM